MEKNSIIAYSLVIFFFLSLGILLSSILYSPLKEESLQDINVRKTEYEKLKRDVSEIERDLVKWQNISSEYSKGKKEYFFMFRDLSKLRMDLKEKMNMLGLDERNFKIRYSKIMRSEYRKAEITFHLAGIYKNIKKMIYEIQNFRKFILIRKVRLSKKGNGPVTASFFLEVFLVP